MTRKASSALMRLIGCPAHPDAEAQRLLHGEGKGTAGDALLDSVGYERSAPVQGVHKKKLPDRPHVASCSS
jgi:hypothetical protein